MTLSSVKCNSSWHFLKKMSLQHQWIVSFLSLWALHWLLICIFPSLSTLQTALLRKVALHACWWSPSVRCVFSFPFWCCHCSFFFFLDKQLCESRSKVNVSFLSVVRITNSDVAGVHAEWRSFWKSMSLDRCGFQSPHFMLRFDSLGFQTTHGGVRKNGPDMMYFVKKMNAA